MGGLYFEAQGYDPVLLENLCGMSCSGTRWLFGGASFECRYGGFWMISYQLMFSVVRSSLVSHILGLILPPLVFSLILMEASKLLHPYSTDNKTSRLMVKRFSTVRDTQRGSQSYMEPPLTLHSQFYMKALSAKNRMCNWKKRKEITISVPHLVYRRTS